MGAQDLVPKSHRLIRLTAVPGLYVHSQLATRLRYDWHWKEDPNEILREDPEELVANVAAETTGDSMDFVVGERVL